ncbi:phosphoglycolate phosphatase, chromosomal [bacterium BMS3Bbin11]|nr:phosphoglycolate phosphatase, chromosomal [bacterium BMS3Abin11]GBE45209.1 phosphoglycolate phosphatase, chromosomal [bacterium BMS3Bbin11]GMT39588.1 MAG: phosphoglycolate phosphatase, bacterial [bacterium]HDH09128.1 phosphoglycolate phosphatase [Gammaproteobacteria bacterium]HDH16869.1 phosphoglycolate phosphatase [Gammaproteobacteria bacterium]
MTNKIPVKMVMIDLDGTLINTAPDLADSVNIMLERMGRDTWPLDKVSGWIGNGVSRLVKRALTDSMNAEPDSDDYDKGYALFLEAYGENVSAKSRPYDGVVAGLDKLKSAGFRLACVTNKAESFTLPLLADLKLDGYFELVVSGDSLPRKKPDPLPLTYACENFGITPQQGVLIGDSANDVKAAIAAGMPVICVNYGYNQGVDLTTLQTQGVIDSLDILDQHINLLN